MTGDALAAALVDRGLDPAELEAKRLLFGSVFDAYPAFAGGTPTDAWWIPGRLEVFGKHTDYGGGHSLIATVPRSEEHTSELQSLADLVCRLPRQKKRQGYMEGRAQ